MVLRFFLFIGVFLFVSCADGERDNPYDPGSKYYMERASSSSKQGSSSSSQIGQSSSAVLPEYGYCVFISDRLCLDGPMSACPPGGTLSNSCPYGSSSSAAATSSSSRPSSSSALPSSSSVIFVGGSCDIRDYRTVVIGSQTWMAENLNCNVNGSKCHGDNPSNCGTYGRLYDWATAMALPSSCNSNSCSSQINAKHKGICPSGWHIPSVAEWITLTDYVGGSSSTAGRKLKATSGWNSCGPSGSGSSYLCEDSYGFSALPGGNGYSDGDFYNVGDDGYWWIASEGTSNYAYSRSIYYNREDVYHVNPTKSNLYSVRCLQDNSSIPPSSSSVLPSSSSVITYTLACANVPSSGTAGTAITPPAVTCNGTAVSSGLTWTNAPTWSNPVVGTYSNVSVSASSGNCAGKSVTCSGTLTVSAVVSSSSQSGIIYGPSVTYEGETYQTVVIGTQTWFKRNLNYNASGSKCYSDEPSNCATYGRLYNWSTAMVLSSDCNSSTCASQVGTKHKGICPSGWHIPSNADWDKLIRYVDDSSGTSSPYNSPTAGRYLKSTSGWNSNGNGEDKYGFSALPGGYGNSDGGFSIVGNRGLWWSASEYGSNSAYRDMYYNYEGVYYSLSSKSDLFSVRCLQD